MESLKEYLFRTGTLQGDSQDIAEAKERYRKRYMSAYLKNYTNERVSRRLFFTKDEFHDLQSFARKHNKKESVSPSFLKQCIWATVRREYIVPDQDQLQRLERGMRAIGNNLNQIARHANQTHHLTRDNMLSVIHLVNSLEELISYTVKNPTAHDN